MASLVDNDRCSRVDTHGQYDLHSSLTLSPSRGHLSLAYLTLVYDTAISTASVARNLIAMQQVNLNSLLFPTYARFSSDDPQRHSTELTRMED